jgi:hypothetical protein
MQPSSSCQGKGKAAMLVDEAWRAACRSVECCYCDLLSLVNARPTSSHRAPAPGGEARPMTSTIPNQPPNRLLHLRLMPKVAAGAVLAPRRRHAVGHRRGPPAGRAAAGLRRPPRRRGRGGFHLPLGVLGHVARVGADVGRGRGAHGGGVGAARRHVGGGGGVEVDVCW